MTPVYPSLAWGRPTLTARVSASDFLVRPQLLIRREPLPVGEGHSPTLEAPHCQSTVALEGPIHAKQETSVHTGAGSAA
jgi:hypothetical protein